MPKLSEAKQIKGKQSKAEQSNAKQSKAKQKQSRAKQSKAKAKQSARQSSKFVRGAFANKSTGGCLILCSVENDDKMFMDVPKVTHDRGSLL